MNQAFAFALLETVRRLLHRTARHPIPRPRSPGGRAHRSWKRRRASGTRTS